MNQHSEDFHSAGAGSTESAQSGSFTHNGIVQDISGCLFKYNKWIKILAVTMFICGIFCAVTIVGIVVAWLPIWLGIILWNLSRCIGNAVYSGETAELEYGLSQLNLYFKILGISLLLVTVLYLLVAVTGISVLTGVLQ